MINNTAVVLALLHSK